MVTQVKVDVTPLPGIGTREDFVTHAGRRVGVIVHRDGKYELLVSAQDDPDRCVASTQLTSEEASTLANLLGAPQLVAQLADQQRDLTGITTQQLHVLPGSPYDGRRLGDAALRTRTSASVVAVVRAGTVHPSPGPDFPFEGGDLVVIVGTADGLSAAAEILAYG
jgi:TrkA domain protein